MTMVAACRVREGAVVIADSRATWLGPGAAIFRDVLQKILPLAPKVGIAFAGDVRAASLIVSQLRRRIHKKPRLGLIRKLAGNVPRIARHYYTLHRSRSSPAHPLVLILFGVADSGRVEIYGFQSPHFNAQKLDRGFLVVGSGEVVRPYLEQNLQAIEQKARDLKAAADSVILGLEGALHGTGVETVGGLFQCVLVDRDGIRPLRYGFANLDPDAPARAKAIEMRAGRWTQRDLGTGREVPLVEPAAIRPAERKHLRVHDVHEASKELPKWHLTYFITCVAVDIRPGTIEFKGVMTGVGAFEYPLTVKLLATVGFWGTAGEHEMIFTLEHDGVRRELRRERVTVQVFPEEVDNITELAITVSAPGPAFLECAIGGQILGRRALYFGQVTSRPPDDEAAFSKFAREQSEALSEAQRSSTDPVIESTGRAELVYLSLCYECFYDGTTLRFDRQIAVAYWRTYPLPFRMFVASGFRLPRGEHRLRVDLVDVAARATTTVTTATVEGSSSCFVTPVHGKIVAVIPKPGWYFVNVYVDDQRSATALLAAETDRPQFSYKLADDILASVAAGELFVLLKRARQETPSAPDRAG